MKVSPFAGKPAEASMLVNVPKLITAYYTEVPDPSMPEQRVSFGTSGHRGSALENYFIIAAIPRRLQGGIFLTESLFRGGRFQSPIQHSNCYGKECSQLN